MKTKLNAFLICLFVLPFSVAAEHPLGGELGAVEFEKSCASCHGFDGKGKGYMSEDVEVSPADLTNLSKKNSGHFPFTQVYRTIDGTSRVGVHGTRDMPEWGEEYRKEARRAGLDERVYTRGVIMELILHIYSLQE